MRRDNRLFGNNMQAFMYYDKVSREELMQKLGYTGDELERIMSARVYVSEAEEQRIARCLKRPLKSFFERLTNAQYQEAGCFECRGEFQDTENQELIFDIIDMYCDVQEALSDEK